MFCKVAFILSDIGCFLNPFLRFGLFSFSLNIIERDKKPVGGLLKIKQTVKRGSAGLYNQ